MHLPGKKFENKKEGGIFCFPFFCFESNLDDWKGKEYNIFSMIFVLKEKGKQFFYFYFGKDVRSLC